MTTVYEPSAQGTADEEKLRLDFAAALQEISNEDGQAANEKLKGIGPFAVPMLLNLLTALDIGEDGEWMIGTPPIQDGLAIEGLVTFLKAAQPEVTSDRHVAPPYGRSVMAKGLLGWLKELDTLDAILEAKTANMN